jgi:hypothetical protein
MRRRIRDDDEPPMSVRTVPAHIVSWLLAHPTLPAATAAARLGLTTATIYAYRSWLIKRGVLAPRYQRIDWEAAEIAYQDGLITRDAARRLRITTQALHSAIRNRGLRVEDLRAGQVFTGVELARLCGVLTRYSTHWLPRLQAAGLRVRVTTRGGPGTKKRRTWRITAAAFLDFLHTPAAHDMIDPAQIVDVDWRAAAWDARIQRCDDAVY